MAIMVFAFYFVSDRIFIENVRPKLIFENYFAAEFFPDFQLVLNIIKVHSSKRNGQFQLRHFHRSLTHARHFPIYLLRTITNSTFFGLCRLGCSDKLPIIGDSIFFFKGYRNAWPGGHEGYEVIIKRTIFVYFVKCFCRTRRKVDHF